MCSRLFFWNPSRRRFCRNCAQKCLRHVRCLRPVKSGLGMDKARIGVSLVRVRADTGSCRELGNFELGHENWAFGTVGYRKSPRRCGAARALSRLRNARFVASAASSAAFGEHASVR